LRYHSPLGSANAAPRQGWQPTGSSASVCLDARGPVVISPPLSALALERIDCQPKSNTPVPTLTLRRGKTMKIRPLHDRLIVKRVAEETKTKGGIIIPDSAKEKPLEAKVIAVGNGKILEDGKVRPMDIKAGDTVLFSKYSGTELKIEGEEHLILREEDVIGIVEK
jgi:chaperonin GroES